MPLESALLFMATMTLVCVQSGFTCQHLMVIPPPPRVTRLYSDFGVDHLVNVAGKTDFPWLLSNVRDKSTGRLLAEGKETVVVEWQGRKVRTYKGGR